MNCVAYSGMVVVITNYIRSTTYRMSDHDFSGCKAVIRADLVSNKLVTGSRLQVSGVSENDPFDLSVDPSRGLLPNSALLGHSPLLA